MDSNIKEIVETYSNQVRIANNNDKVYKDECVYSYDTPESENGLYICLKTFVGVSKQFLSVHFSKTASHLYLHVKTHRMQVLKNDDSLTGEPEKKKPSKLGIGVEGGFDLSEKEFYFEHEYALFIYPENLELRLDSNSSNPNLTENVHKSILSVINAESIHLKEELASQAASWDGETRFVSKHSSNLYQVPNPPQISPDPNSWKCDKCNLKNNLWLNLTDGKMLCGRRQLDGSGGNNHAIEHFNNTKYPLSVKLGTITAKSADVYSYDEDDMVEDSNLAVHLSHFGINMSKMEKTEKTMAELEIDLNQKVGEWDRIQESGSKLVPLYGPGYTGMRNLGNSCYMNSVMQTLFNVPDFIKKYFKNFDAYVNSSSSDPSNDFNFQMSKLANGLLSGRYSFEETKTEQELLKPPKGIKPNSFKYLVGRGHAEFSTKKQQDAHEFLTYLFDLIERNLRKDTVDRTNPIDAFKFKLEDRFECSQTHQVRYKTRTEYCLPLPISKDLATNKEQLLDFEKRKADLASKGEKLQPGDLVRPEIRMEDCLKLFTQDEIISDFYSSAAKSVVNAIKSTRISTFPDFLLIQARKFEFAPDWTPVKLDISLQVPDTIDLNKYKSQGLRSNEVELPEESNENQQEESIQINQEIVSQLMDMGFTLEGSQRAVFNTREVNNSEAAVNWAVTHMEDPDFNMPFQLPSAKKDVKKANNKALNEESISSLMSFGFNRNQAIKALEATNDNLERAADWIFNHAEELMDVNEGESSTAQSETTDEFRNGNGVYKLVAFISHMGTNANVGHYVAHILKDDKWVIFNDENVAQSENPPKDLAYLYLYKRV